MGHGVLQPAFTLVLGKMTEDFTPDKPSSEIIDLAGNTSLIMFLLGIGALFASGFGLFIFTFVGKVVGARVKKLYFRKLME